MNIPYLHRDPEIAALMSPDKWRTKLSIEAVQMMANAYTVEMLETAPLTVKGTVRSNKCHPHNRFSKWALQSIHNWNWLCDYAIAAIFSANESGLYKKGLPLHLSFVEWCLDNPPELPDLPFSDVPALDGFENDDRIQGHRDYFIATKQHLAIWTGVPIPEWFIKR